MIILILFVYGTIAALMIPRLVKKKYWRDLAAFCVFLAIACTLSLMQSSGIDIPSPAKAIKSFFDSLNLHY